MSNSVRREKKQFVIDVIIIVIIAIATAVIVWILSVSKETKTITQTETSEHESVVCINDSDGESFFKSDSIIRVSHEIKVLLKNDKMDSISLRYVGEFSSNNEADQMGGVFHGNYNKYFAKYNLNPSDYSPNFVIDANTVTISLFGSVNSINTYTSKLFFIDSSDYYKIKAFSINEIESYYKNRGFSCNYYE